MLQQTSMDKEEKRILAMRARAQARTQKFLSARQRTIGIDTDGLAAQLEEKRQIKAAQDKADADQGEYGGVGGGVGGGNRWELFLRGMKRGVRGVLWILLSS